MPSFRRAAGRLVGALPDKQGKQVRRLVRSAERRLPGGQQEPVAYVVSPHPDDETLRLAGFVTWLRARHPERRVVLVAVGDGGGSSRARKMGWSPEYEREYRRAEQAAAWSALTGGAGEIIRIGLSDNTFTAQQVRDALAPLNKRGAQFYVAAHEEDYHSDHLAVVAGVRLLNPAHAWISLSPIMPGKGKVYKPPPSAADGVAIAVRAYDGFGRLSVPPEFRAHEKAGYRSRVTPLASPPAPTSAPRDAKKPDLVAVDRLTLSFDPSHPAPARDLSLVMPTEESLAELAERYPGELSERKHGILWKRQSDPSEDAWLIQDSDGAVAGFCAVSWADHYEAAYNYWMRLKPHQFLYMDDLVFKDHRRRGVHRFSIQRRWELARDRGLTEGLVLIQADNAASLASYRSLGAEYAGRLYFSRRAGRSLMIPEPVAERLRQKAGQE